MRSDDVQVGLRDHAHAEVVKSPEIKIKLTISNLYSECLKSKQVHFSEVRLLFHSQTLSKILQMTGLDCYRYMYSQRLNTELVPISDSRYSSIFPNSVWEWNVRNRNCRNPQLSEIGTSQDRFGILGS